MTKAFKLLGDDLVKLPTGNQTKKKDSHVGKKVEVFKAKLLKLNKKIEVYKAAIIVTRGKTFI